MHGLTLPRRLQVELSGVVQRHADKTGGEITAEHLWRIFSQEYLEARSPITYIEHQLVARTQGQGLRLKVELGGQRRTLVGHGNGPIDALVNALGLPIRLQSYEERSLDVGADSKAAAFVELAMDGLGGPKFGVGIHSNILTASFLAVLSAVNRAFAGVDEASRAQVLSQLDATPTAA